MTLVLTINGPETIWLLADRRLSSRGRTVKDDARKVMFLETLDGVSILGYAGLGATATGTEPADWMSAVLRGRKLTLEQSLGVLADAMKRQFPKHMLRMPGKEGPAHTVLITAFVGNEARLYTIDMAFATDRKSYNFRYTRHVVEKPTFRVPKTPRIGIAGSGALYLTQSQKWARHLLHLVRACDQGQISANRLASHLASLNKEVHEHTSDRTVGPRCVVAWRNKKGGKHKDGGAHQFFTGTVIDSNPSSLPMITNGMDISAVLKVIMPRNMRIFEAMQQSHSPPELDELTSEIARIPNTPDENLR